MYWAGDKVVLLSDGFKVNVSPFSYIEKEVAEGRFEEHRVALLHTLLSDKKPFVDIGSNVGFFSLLAASKGSRVDAFEPADVNFQRLCSNCALNAFTDLITTHQIALGEKTTSADLYAPLNENYGMIALDRREAGVKIGSVVVEALDNVLDVPSVPVIVKIDVEGYEEKVLKGARKWIYDVAVGSAWVVEIHVSFRVNYKRIEEFFTNYSITYFCDEDGSEQSQPIEKWGQVVLIARKS